MTDPGTVMARLAEIDTDLANRQNAYEKAAEDRARHLRDWEKRLAQARVQAEGRDSDTRKAQALIAAIAEDDLYEKLQEAEASFEAQRVVIRLLEARATIGQSILKAQGRG